PGRDLRVGPQEPRQDHPRPRGSQAVRRRQGGTQAAGAGWHMTTPQVVVYPNAELLAAATAARLVTRLVDAQAARGSASLVLTGGGTGIAVLEQLRATPARDAIDWSRVDLYWGDERFLPSGHPERNETQARAALLDHVPVAAERVHAMAPSDGPFGDNP